MPLDASLTYNELTAQAEIVIRDYVNRAAAAGEYLDARMYRCFAYGAYLMWSTVAHKAALNISHAAVNEYQADRDRLNGIMDDPDRVNPTLSLPRALPE
jgi:hypothetical protein